MVKIKVVRWIGNDPLTLQPMDYTGKFDEREVKKGEGGIGGEGNDKN